MVKGMGKNKYLLIILGIIVVVAVVAATCNRQVVYTCEDGTKVFNPDDCPMVEVPVEESSAGSQEKVEPEQILEESISLPSEMITEGAEEQGLEEQDDKGADSDEVGEDKDEAELEPLEVEDTTAGFTFTIKNISFTPRTITSVFYYSENNMSDEIDPYTLVYSIDLETRKKELLDNFKLGMLRPGQSREKEESTTIHLKQREGQLLLFSVFDMAKGKASIANVTYMLDYESEFGE